jgi:hypothetical protein
MIQSAMPMATASQNRHDIPATSDGAQDDSADRERRNQQPDIAKIDQRQRVAAKKPADRYVGNDVAETKRQIEHSAALVTCGSIHLAHLDGLDVDLGPLELPLKSM